MFIALPAVDEIPGTQWTSLLSELTNTILIRWPKKEDRLRESIKGGES